MKQQKLIKLAACIDIHLAFCSAFVVCYSVMLVIGVHLEFTTNCFKRCVDIKCVDFAHLFAVLFLLFF